MCSTRFALLVALTAALLAAGPLTALSQELITQKALSADMALTIAQGALERCRADGYRVSVTVIDNGNMLKAFVRDDGSGIGTVDLSRRKAFTSLAYRKTSAEQVKIWNSAPQPVYIPEAGAPAAGGVPIKVGNDVIGAIGVSGAPGGDKDEACANAGIAKVADKLK
jgi:uncharacterized protein GlcG (DUF336 family)